MTGERARRTSSGHTLRLVGGEAALPGPGGSTREDESIVLPGQRQSVAVGRHWVVSRAVSLGITGMANQVLELLSSEILANAVLHGASGADIGLRMALDDEVVRVSVSDGGDRTPVVLHHEPTAPNGRGMAIVEAMSSRWGVLEQADGGKTVWYELDLADF